MEIVEVTICLNELFPACLNYFSIQAFNLLPEMFKVNPKSTKIKVNYEHTLFREHPETVFALKSLTSAFLDYCVPRLAKIRSYSHFDDARRNELLMGAIVAVHKILYKRLTMLTFGVDIEFITALSGEMYESSATANFQMAILPNKKAFHGVNFNQDNCRELKVQNIHAIRKQLNLAKNGAIAVIPPSDGGKCCPYTIGFMSNSEASHFPRFRFVNHMAWEFHVPGTLGTCRMCYWQGHLALPERILGGEILSAVEKVFPDKRKSELVRDVIVQLLEQRKGAVAIFAEPSVMKKEVQRLVTDSQRGIAQESGLFPVAGRPKKLCKARLLEQAENLRRITEIDGAVMIDTDGNCHAYGVILDGVCTSGVKGDMARGARLNCTKAYVEWRKSQSRDSWLGIVISEDGMYDLLG